MYVHIIQQPETIGLLELAHLLQVIRNPRDAAVRIPIGGIVPILIRRRVPAAIHIRPGKEHPRPAPGYRAGNQRGGVHGFHRLRPLDIARQHVVVSGRLRVNIDVVGIPPLRLVVHAPQAHAARVGRTVASHDLLHPLLGEGLCHGNVGVTGVIHHRVAVEEYAVSAVGIVGGRCFLRTIFLHAEAAFAGGLGRPVHQGDGSQADGAGGQVG